MLLSLCPLEARCDLHAERFRYLLAFIALSCRRESIGRGLPSILWTPNMGDHPLVDGVQSAERNASSERGIQDQGRPRPPGDESGVTCVRHVNNFNTREDLP